MKHLSHFSMYSYFRKFTFSALSSVLLVFTHKAMAAPLYQCAVSNNPPDCQINYSNPESACHEAVAIFNRDSPTIFAYDFIQFRAPNICDFTETNTNNNPPTVNQLETGLSVTDDNCVASQIWNETTQQCEVQKNRGDCEGESCCLGNPIHSGTGHKYQTETDITLTSLIFSRTYNSTNLQLNIVPVSTVLGIQWNHVFERYVIVNVLNPNAAHVTRPDGKSYLFILSGIQWIPDADVEDQLEQLTDGQGTPIGWRYTPTDNTVEDYAVSGQLLSITDVRGNSQTLSYDTNNRLDRVDTNTGEFLQFSYDASDRISTITDQAARTWTYHYDVNNNLEFVDNPDGTTKQYHYNEPAFTSTTNLPHALTGITDERGLRYATFEYQADGRATATYHAGNAQRVDITYNDANGTRIVTNSLNQLSTYSTAVQLGVALVTDVSGPGCATCGTGNSSYDYNPANNNLMSRTENGVTTKFNNYDSKGQFSCKVEGITSTDTSTGVCAFDPVVSPEARRTDYTYDSRFNNKTTTISAPSVFDSNP